MCDDAGMTAGPAHFVRTTDDGYEPTPFAQSLWGDDHLNGPAVVGLAASVLEEGFGEADLLPARLTVDLFKAARGVPTTVTSRLVRDGRRVRNTECEIVQNGVPVARAVMTQYRRSASPPGDEWSRTTRFDFPADVEVGQHVYVGCDDLGWTPGIAEHQNAARKRALQRPIAAIAGRINSPFVNAVLAAETTSLVTNLGSAGVGYINGDLTVALCRLPVGDWIGLQADDHLTAEGISTGTATLFDVDGPFGTGMVTAVSNPAAQIDFTTNSRSELIR